MLWKKNSIQRDLFFGVVFTALVFAVALVLGRPFLSASPASAASVVSAPHSQHHSTTVNGTIKSNGNQVYLSDRSGNTYQLDNAQLLRSLEGRFVTVTGMLDSQSMLIHVEKIETVDA